MKSALYEYETGFDPIFIPVWVHFLSQVSVAMTRTRNGGAALGVFEYLIPANPKFNFITCRHAICLTIMHQAIVAREIRKSPSNVSIHRSPVRFGSLLGHLYLCAHHSVDLECAPLACATTIPPFLNSCLSLRSLFLQKKWPSFYLANRIAFRSKNTLFRTFCHFATNSKGVSTTIVTEGQTREGKCRVRTLLNVLYVLGWLEWTERQYSHSVWSPREICQIKHCITIFMRSWLLIEEINS